MALDFTGDKMAKQAKSGPSKRPKLAKNGPKSTKNRSKIETKATKTGLGKPKLATFRGFKGPKTAKKPCPEPQKSPTKGWGFENSGSELEFQGNYEIGGED